MEPQKLTEKILTFWEENDCFQKSIEQRPEEFKFRFFDGPPFTSGSPHYGHLLSSSIKDLVPRYKTMKGYKVKRKWGWDCHGLPVENKVEDKLNIKSKEEIEDESKVGIEKFTDECRKYVQDVNDQWGRFVDHIGRWVDMENAYYTMDKSYMESVMNIFQTLYDKDYIFKGYKIQGYCPRCATTLSKHEINEGYEDKQDKAVTVKFPLKQSKIKDYQSTENGIVDVVVGIVSKDDKKLMIYQESDNAWLFPGGKVEQGESLEDALDREIKEEIGTKVVNKTLRGSTKVVYNSGAYRVHYYDIEIDGKPTIQEEHNHTDIKWIEQLQSDNELGFAIKIDDTIIDDKNTIQKEFIDYHIFNSGLLSLEGTNDAKVNILARTTTPWTLVNNMFLAVGQNIEYSMIFDKKAKEYFILASELLNDYYSNEDDYVFINKLFAKDLIDFEYEALYNFYYENENINSLYKDSIHKIIIGDHVSTESGTGIVHIAPAFGEEDYDIVANLKDYYEDRGIDLQDWPFDLETAQDWIYMTIDEYGKFQKGTGKFEGKWVFDGNEDVIDDLKQRDKLVYLSTINHEYPHCRRCDTPLIYKATDSWFVQETEHKDKILEKAKDLNFVPSKIKSRFDNILRSAPDWNISRKRYWGAPIPIWECDECGDRKVYGSIKDLEKDSGQEVDDLHRPHIDKITIDCEKCDGTYYRIPDVLDCWFESGSMPYGEVHYPFSDENFEFPAQFIAEGLDQTRGWFRALHVLGTLAHDSKAFENVVVNGLILAEDGKKMSKSLQNFPDPKLVVDKYGADAFRLYTLGSPVVKSEPFRFIEDEVEQTMKDFTIPFDNVFNFFATYADIDNYKHTGNQVYFMRHGHKESNSKDASITKKALNVMESEEFQQKIYRLDIDKIYVSKLKRTHQTGEKVQKIVSKYNQKNIEIQEVELWDRAENTVDIYKNILEDHNGENILIVGHYQNFAPIWSEYYNTSINLQNKVKYKANYLEIIKLPTYKITDQLDRWILAETYNTIDQIDKHMNNYHLDEATNSMLELMDKLTNWYLRRSRRRFWAEGMGEDKISAYNTLFEVLSLYAKISAPFAPFISEDIFQRLNKFTSKNLGSVHLEFWPVYNDKYIDKNLIEEIQQVRDIISLSLYIRAKNKIKVKQPLQKLSIKTT